MCVYCENVHSERERETDKVLNTYCFASKLEPVEPIPAHTVEYSSIHRALHIIVKKEQKSKTGSVREREGERV